MAPFKCFLILQLVFVTVLLAPSKSQEYVARVIAYPSGGPFRSGQSIPLQCTITPEPPFPVEYLWRSSACNNFDTDNDIPSESPIITVAIEENHPSSARYFCHVLSADSQTTLAVGSTVLQISGILEPVGSVVKVFTPPSSLTMEVDINEEYSRRRLLRSVNGITYEWKHNRSGNMLKDVRVRNNILLIPQTTPRHAGDYSVSITSFGLLNSFKKTCSRIVLAALRNYAVFQSVEFLAKSSAAIATWDQTASSLESSKYIFPIGHDIQNISFVSGERSETTVSVPLTPLGKYALSQNFDGRSFLLKVFYNGEYIYKRQRKSHSNDVRHPSLLYFNYVLIRKEREISVTLELPTPVREDEGIYELQIFFSTFEIMQRLRTLNCSDYGNFLYSYEGLKLDYVLVGSTTLQFQNYAPEVNVSATQLILSPTQSAEPLPKLTCSVEESSFPVSQLKWTKGITELAQTQSSQTLDFQISNNRAASVFGTYTCEATRGQTKAKNTIHIAERAHFHMSLLPISGIRCVDITDRVKNAMLEVLLTELQLSVSFENDSNMTRDIFTNPSLGCSSEAEGSDYTFEMSADVIFSNSDGSVTASALVARTEEWMNGVRTVNGLSLQLSSSVSQRGTSEMGLDEGQMVAIVLSLISAIIFVIAIAILATCVTVRYKEHSKKKLVQEKNNPQNNFPQETESTIDQETNYVLANKTDPAKVMVIPKVSSLQCQSSTLMTGINHEQALNKFQPDSNTAEHSSTLVTTGNKTSELSNSKATNEPQRMSDISMVLAPNYAYNGMQWRDENRQIRDKKTTNRRRNLPISSPRQYSVEHSYDYPQLRFAAGQWQGKRKSTASSTAHDSITTVTNTSYSMGSK